VPKFNLPLTTAISAAILATTACSNSRDWQTSNDTKVCIDDNSNRVDEGNCNNRTGPYRWYYISRGGYIPYYGNWVSGGSYFPSTTSTGYATAPAEPPPGAVTRAGFGSHGGGEGGDGAGE
jgi:hypothetical protein